MVQLHLDSLVARGNTSDVYHWGSHAIVKLLRPGIPHGWATREAQTTALVHAAGLPAPMVLDEVTIDGRRGIIFERIDGVSMWDRMLAYPDEIRSLTRILAELQKEVSATVPPPGIPRLTDRLHKKIENASRLTPDERRATLDDLEHVPEAGDALCHFDIHPNNVLMGPDRPVVIDWYDAATGSSAADIVRASMLMREDAADNHLPCVDPSIINHVHDSYVDAVLRVRSIDADELASWESSVLAARLAEPISDAAIRATHGMWRAARARQPTDLVLRFRPAATESTGVG